MKQSPLYQQLKKKDYPEIDANGNSRPLSPLSNESRKTDQRILESLTLPCTKEEVGRYNETRRKTATKHQGFKFCY